MIYHGPPSSRELGGAECPQPLADTMSETSTELNRILNISQQRMHLYMESIVFATATPVLFRDFEGVAGLFPNLVVIHDDTCPTAIGTKTRILLPSRIWAPRSTRHVTPRGPSQVALVPNTSLQRHAASADDLSLRLLHGSGRNLSSHCTCRRCHLHPSLILSNYSEKTATMARHHVLGLNELRPTPLRKQSNQPSLGK